MPLDESAAARIRTLLADRDDVTERTIVGGGIGFMVGGHLCVGLSPRGLTVRVGKAAMAAALARPHSRPLEFGGRTADGFVVVEPQWFESEEDLGEWVERGLAFVATLPPK
ncbi:MAG TPA: TfoX/Sxy family protein [Trueperaceae bacterium]|nr:TfoX/Sxy family protein [Trueperaceae bacterium]